MRWATCVLLLGAFASQARAGERAVSTSSPATTAAGSTSLQIDGFDPSSGTLRQVRVELRASLSGAIEYENTSYSAGTGLVNLRANATLTGPGGFSLGAAPRVQAAAQVSAYDGVLDQAGTSGGRLTLIDTVQSSVSKPTNLAAWTSTGLLDLTLARSHSVSPVYTNFALTLEDQLAVGATVLVTYVFDAPLDCDSDTIPDADEPDTDGDGYPDDCDTTTTSPPVANEASYTRPGSLLVFPEFDNVGRGSTTLLTITNVDSAAEPAGSVRVRFVYVSNCVGVEAPPRTLVRNDTFTAVTSFHAPAATRGYVYAFACDASGRAIARDVLIGSTLRLSNENINATHVNAIPFGAKTPPGSLVDADSDGALELNGLEYEPAPDRIVVPSFVQRQFFADLALVLIDLSGLGPSTGYVATASVDRWNDAGLLATAQVQWQCWTRTDLESLDASPFTFTSLGTGSTETIAGLPGTETGWASVGGVSSLIFPSVFIANPSILAVVVESASQGGESGFTEVAGQPYYSGARTNGRIVPPAPQIP